MLKVLSSRGGHTHFVSPLVARSLSFLALIAVYRPSLITCETGRVIFLPKVWILSRPIGGFIAPSLRWLNLNGWLERRSTGREKRERGWQRGLTWALNHAPRNPPSTGSWQPHCHHGQATSYASWQHWSRISQSIRCKLALFKDDNEHQDTCRCHWRDAIMIGCPSHHAPLGLMVFRPGMGREERGTEWTGRKFCVVNVISLYYLVCARVAFLEDPMAREVDIYTGHRQLHSVHHVPLSPLCTNNKEASVKLFETSCSV